MAWQVCGLKSYKRFFWFVCNCWHKCTIFFAWYLFYPYRFMWRIMSMLFCKVPPHEIGVVVLHRSLFNTIQGIGVVSHGAWYFHEVSFSVLAVLWSLGGSAGVILLIILCYPYWCYSSNGMDTDSNWLLYLVFYFPTGWICFTFLGLVRLVLPSSSCFKHVNGCEIPEVSNYPLLWGIDSFSSVTNYIK